MQVQCGEIAPMPTTQVLAVPKPGCIIAVPNDVIPSNIPVEKGNIGNAITVVSLDILLSGV